VTLSNLQALYKQTYLSNYYYISPQKRGPSVVCRLCSLSTSAIAVCYYYLSEKHFIVVNRLTKFAFTLPMTTITIAN